MGEMAIALKPEHLKRYGEFARLLWRYRSPDEEAPGKAGGLWLLVATHLQDRRSRRQD